MTTMARPSKKLTAVLHKSKQWHDEIAVGNLRISFHRTVRVSDNDKANNPPPNLGGFPLCVVSDYAATIPAPMLSKGGFFLPMYRKHRSNAPQRARAES